MNGVADMKFFVVTYVHPDSEGWNKYLLAHVAYLENLLKEGTLRASGPFIGTPHKSAMLILSTASRKDVLDVIAKDPFQIQGLVTETTVTEWDPVFGTYQDESSRAHFR
jgi:uncharacterized protein YciI